MCHFGSLSLSFSNDMLFGTTRLAVELTRLRSDEISSDQIGFDRTGRATEAAQKAAELVPEKKRLLAFGGKFSPLSVANLGGLFCPLKRTR